LSNLDICSALTCAFIFVFVFRQTRNAKVFVSDGAATDEAHGFCGNALRLKILRFADEWGARLWRVVVYGWPAAGNVV
jgi:hypothetical protein